MAEKVAAKADFDISRLVEEVYEASSYAAAQKGLRFTFSISHKLPRLLYGDRDSIKKALGVITLMAIEDSQSGTVELNVDFTSQPNTGLIVKFSVSESSRKNPYWFAVTLKPSKSKKTA